MQLWFPLLAANAMSLLLLIQTLLTKDPERLRWLRRRALLTAWVAFLGALLIVGFAANSVYSAYHQGISPELAKKGINPVTGGMRAILVALLLLFLPLAARTVVNGRVKRDGA
ncbi:MAG TPA: hypothetical protein VHB79_14695 [Polyangiaceae bacterium]|nr:hypothetical protein [Polyangiaceae bacterium]